MRDRKYARNEHALSRSRCCKYCLIVCGPLSKSFNWAVLDFVSNLSCRKKIAALDADISGEEWKLTTELEAARAQRDSLRFALDAAIVRAPIDGVVGSVSVRPGDPVIAGAPLGRVVAAAAPRTVVVYIPERDRAFVEKNAAVRVEVDQLPVWEFGALHGRVTRVASEIDEAVTTIARALASCGAP